jgi:hypothetical protein
VLTCNLSREQIQQWMGTWLDLFQLLLLRGMKKPKGFGVYL